MEPLKRYWQPGTRGQSAVILTLLVLLPLLAVLQYRWLGQLSAGEREQMQNSLRATAVRFSREFDHTLTQTYMAFLPGPDAGDANGPNGDDGAAFCAAAYNRWLETASHPKLIKSVHFAASGPTDNGRLQVRELDAATKQFVPGEWPSELDSLRRRFAENAAAFHRLQTPGARPSQEARQGPPPPLEADLPALIVSFISQPPSPPGQEPRRTVNYVVLRLDAEYLRQEMLPALVRSHFAGDGGSYELAVAATGEPRRILFQPGASSTSTGWDFAHDDATAPLFGLNAEEIRRTMRNRFERRDQTAAAHGRDEARTGGIRSSGPPFRFIAGQNEQGGVWQLHLKHRAGSLEAAVAKVRRRNLAVSFGILGVLAASVGLLLLSARRAGRLAQQQMDFVAGISHELRTPLAVIESAGWNLTNGVVKNQAQAQRYGSLIQQQSGNLREMIEQVLEFASAQSGRQHFDLSPTSVSEVLDKVLTDSQPLLAEGNFVVEQEVAPALPTVLADPQALARAVQNLLTNAMKYGGEARWISLRAEAVTHGKRAEVRITVSDKGNGIAPADLPHIFEPFYRSNEVRAAQIHGNGLGLSLVKNIVAAHGGHIAVESRPGAGSSFTITLPVAEVSESQPAVSPSPSTVSGGEALQ